MRLIGIDGSAREIANGPELEILIRLPSQNQDLAVA